MKILEMIPTLLIKSPRFSILMLLFINIFSAFISLSYVKMNDIDKFYLPTESEVLKTSEKTELIFGSDNSLIAILKSDDIFDKNFLLKIKKFADLTASSKYWEKVTTLTNQDHIEGDSEGFSTTPLVDLSQLDKFDHDHWKMRIKQDPFGLRAIVSNDYKSTLLIGKPVKLDSTETQVTAHDVFHNYLKKTGLKPHLVGYSGVMANYTTRHKVLIRENLVFVPIVLLFGMLVVFILFKNLFYLPMMVLFIGASLGLSQMLFALFNLPLTSVSSVLGPLLTAVVTAILVHIFSVVSLLQNKTGMSCDNQDLLRKVFRRLTLTTFFIVLTTSAGLASLMLSPIPAVYHFGLVGSISVVITYFLIMIFLPGPLLKWGLAKKDRASKRSSPLFRNILLFLNRISLRHPVKVISFYITATALAVLFMFEIQADTNLLRFFKDSHPLNQSSNYMEDHFFGVSNFSVILETSEVDRFKKIDFLKTVERIQIWLKKQKGIGRTASMNDYIKEIDSALTNKQFGSKVLPSSNAMISQYLFIYDGNDLFDVVNHDFNTTQILAFTNIHGTQENSVLFSKLENYIRSLKLDSNIKWSISGPTKNLTEQDRLLLSAQKNSIWLAALLIFILLFFYTKNISETLICLVPNVLAPVFIFGFMGCLSIYLDMATVLVASVIVGVAVDDTFHYISQYKMNRAKGARVSSALTRAGLETGRAVTATTIVLSAQFITLMFSNFNPTADFGLLGFIGVATALMLDLTLLPSLIILSWKINRTGIKLNR